MTLDTKFEVVALAFSVEHVEIDGTALSTEMLLYRSVVPLKIICAFNYGGRILFPYNATTICSLCITAKIKSGRYVCNCSCSNCTKVMAYFPAACIITNLLPLLRPKAILKGENLIGAFPVLDFREIKTLFLR